MKATFSTYRKIDTGKTIEDHVDRWTLDVQDEGDRHKAQLFVRSGKTTLTLGPERLYAKTTGSDQGDTIVRALMATGIADIGDRWRRRDPLFEFHE